MISSMIVNLSFVIWAIQYIAREVFTGEKGTYDQFKFYTGMYSSLLMVESSFLIPLLVFAEVYFIITLRRTKSDIKFAKQISLQKLMFGTTVVSFILWYIYVIGLFMYFKNNALIIQGLGLCKFFSRQMVFQLMPLIFDTPLILTTAYLHY
jgi:hypothetical protein